jgi:SnoaL-like domain
VRGRENLAAIAAKAPHAGLYRHFTVNALVTSLAGDRATGQAYFLVVSPGGQIPQLGRYVDVIVRDGDGQWRFSERMDPRRLQQGHHAERLTPWAGRQPGLPSPLGARTAQADFDLLADPDGRRAVIDEPPGIGD